MQVNQGSLYPALHRLEQKGWLKAEWKPSETGREAKFYSLTRAGRKQLAIEKESWARLTGGGPINLQRRRPAMRRLLNWFRTRCGSRKISTANCGITWTAGSST